MQVFFWPGARLQTSIVFDCLLTILGSDSLREILHNEFDEEFETRFVGKKQTRKHRTPLNALGPWHQEHSDGHEKLSEQGLDIGAGIHLPIYGTKDQWSSFLHALLLMPNVRTGTAIAHYYLDLVESRDCESYCFGS